ncbi:microtubule-associated protein RP/EB family member 1 [Dermacentor silvarum]|uniref:microtubule-associated protein RP/EB family member 1 n=1 Tax=Dermacentor silvarum TaxID=543639 RepID=UPI001897AD9C|nr:microtubule-associated protein RP/EB family member 1 [Dermacentor silvarum]
MGVSPNEFDDNEENFNQLRTATEDLATRYDKVEDLCPGATYCLFTDMLARGSFNLAEIALRTPLEPEYVENFGEPQTSLGQVEGDKSVPMARLAENSFQDNFQLVQGSEDFFDTDSEAEGCTRVAIASSRSHGSLVDPRIVGDSTAVKTHAMTRTKLTFDAGSTSDANDEQSIRRIFLGKIYVDGRSQNLGAQGGPVLALQMRNLHSCKHGVIEVICCEHQREHGKNNVPEEIKEIMRSTYEDTHRAKPSIVNTRWHPRNEFV